MAKAAEAFRTISEVADDLGIQKHVLRFWEIKFSQIRPMKRGGGRRYYRPEDMELLRGIRKLLHRDGYTIKGVQKILREQGVEAVKRESELRDKAASAARPGETVVQSDSASRATPRTVRPDSPPRILPGSAGDAAADRPSKKVLRAILAELLACREALGAAPPVLAGPASAERGPRDRGSRRRA